MTEDEKRKYQERVGLGKVVKKVGAWARKGQRHDPRSAQPAARQATTNPADHANAPVLESSLNTRSVRNERLRRPGPDDNTVSGYQYEGGTERAPAAAPTIDDHTVSEYQYEGGTEPAPAPAPTIASETSGAPRGTTRIPYGSGGGQKVGTGNILLTNTQGNPAGEIVGDVSGFRRRQTAGRRPTVASAAEARFRNAVQPGGRGRSARRPGTIVQEPTRQPTVQEEIGPLNTLGDYIREGAKLKARKMQADIRKTDSDIQRARDVTEEARDRTAIDRQKLDVDREGVAGLNEERRARADSLEAETRMSRTEADLQDKMLNATTDEERNTYAQQLQQIKAYKPASERNMNMTQNQIVKERARSTTDWRLHMQTSGEEITYGEYLRKYEPELAGVLGETEPQPDPGGEYPPLPPPGSKREPGVEYTAPNGQIVIYDEKGRHRVVSQ